MLINPVQNLRAFVLTRPPVVIFIISLTVIAACVLSLSFIVRNRAMRNPDITSDWNLFLEKFSKLDLCLHNASSRHLLPVPSITKHSLSELSGPVRAARSVPDLFDFVPVKPLNLAGDDASEDASNSTVSVSAAFTLRIDSALDDVFSNQIKQIRGAVCAILFGVRGPHAKANVSVTMDFMDGFRFNKSLCDSDLGCHITLPVCLTFYASSGVFPKTKMPDTCQTVSPVYFEREGAVMTDLSCPKHVRWAKKKMQDSARQCNGTRIHMNYDQNPDLTVMLTQHDHEVMNLHLLHTSYFLFVMVMSMLCYAAVKGGGVAHHFGGRATPAHPADKPLL